MDWLTFIAAVVSATAWPIAVLIIFLVIRKPLLELSPCCRDCVMETLKLTSAEK